MMETLAALGPFRFALRTAAYQTLRRSAEYRWPAQERLTKGPARQFVGPGNETIDLDGVIYPHFKGGLVQLDALREYAGQGQPLALTTGTGLVLGNWCIERVEETQAVLFANGTPRRVEFRLTLARYND